MTHADPEATAAARQVAAEVKATLDARETAEPGKPKSDRMPFDWKHTEKCRTGVSEG